MKVGLNNVEIKNIFDKGGNLTGNLVSEIQIFSRIEDTNNSVVGEKILTGV